MVQRHYGRLLLFLFLCMIYITGCDKVQSSEAQSQQKDDNIELQVEKPSEKVAPIDPTSEVTQPLDNMQELSIYSIDKQTAEKISITAMVRADKELTPQIIVDKVVESMADETFVIGIDSVKTSDDTIIVSFKDDQPPVTNVGSGVEADILDAIAQSLLDNLPDYHKVIYRIMDGPYETGHFMFGVDTVYLEN